MVGRSKAQASDHLLLTNTRFMVGILTGAYMKESLLAERERVRETESFKRLNL